MCTAYKIYAEVLKRRLEEEVELKKLLPESQGGFRRSRGTLDNIFVLNHIVQREKNNKKEGKVYAMFVDFKAAFDNIDRKKLWESMKEKRINRKIIGRLEKIYEETRSTIKTKDGLTSYFKTTKGVRQGCVMSPLLFNLYIADIDEYMRKRGIGGLRLGKDRIWSLAYADDLVLVAKNREALLDMMDTLRRFTKERKLILNTEKTKIMVFNKGGKEKKEKWRWEGKEIEEVQNFKYLGFNFNRKGDYREHIKDLKKKGRLALNKVWGLGERICRDDFRRRGKLFRYLVQSVMSYGVEIWGWEEQKDLEKILMDYVRWVFRLDFCTPRYIIRRELGLEKMKIKWGARARRYEVKVKNMQDTRWVKECWKEKVKEGWKERYGIEREKVLQ